jgi:hypothetical protein
MPGSAWYAFLPRRVSSKSQGNSCLVLKEKGEGLEKRF